MSSLVVFPKYVRCEKCGKPVVCRLNVTIMRGIVASSLGFGSPGVVKGSIAAEWNADHGKISRDDLYASFQRLGSRVNRWTFIPFVNNNQHKISSKSLYALQRNAKKFGFCKRILFKRSVVVSTDEEEVKQISRPEDVFAKLYQVEPRDVSLILFSSKGVHKSDELSQETFDMVRAIVEELKPE